MGRKKKNIEDFIKEAVSIHGNRYSYKDTKYLGSNLKTLFFCNKHGHFEQTPNVHLRGHGCPSCGSDIQKRKNSNNTDFFIQKAISMHGDLYDYSNVKYIRNRDRVKIICKKHGEFKQMARYHLDGNGCPSCNESKGELKIKKYLIKEGIEFEREKRFDGCKNILPLPFDFYIEKYNTLIEYDGEQHFKPIKYWNGEDGFNKIKENDLIKNDFAKKNSIELIRIPFHKYNNIENILNKIII